MNRKAAILLLMILLLSSPACAEQEVQPETDIVSQRQQTQETIDRLFDGLDFSELGDVTLSLPGYGRALSVEETARALASGETFSADALLAQVYGAFFETLRSMGKLMLSLMLPVLLAGLLAHLDTGDDHLSPLVHSVCLVIILVPVVLVVLSELEHAQETIISMTSRMGKLLPLLLTLLTAVGGNASSAFLHPVVMAASGSMVFLAREVILRLVMCTSAVTAVNHLSDRAHLTRLAQLLRNAVCWLLGVSFTVFLGAMSMQGVVSASVDGVAIRAAKYAVDNFVPVVGGMFSDTMDTLVGCTLIVKNALGVASVFALSAALISPLMRTLAVVFAFKLSAALLEPIADGQVIGAISDFSRTLVLFLITMLCVATMYFLLIVQLLLVGNLTVMLR